MNALLWSVLALGGIAFDDSQGTLVTFDGLQSRTPADWTSKESTSKFRIKEFRLPAAKEDSTDADLTIFFFGVGSGGSVDDNIKRWKTMLVPPEGKTIEDVSKLENKKINGVDVAYFEIAGSYKFKERPFDQKEQPQLRPNYRMIDVIMETKNGPYFIRLVGPAATVEHHKKAFDGWLNAFK
jgi:hypothetical protein